MIDNNFEAIYLAGVLVASVIRKKYTGKLSQKEKMEMFRGRDGLFFILVSFGMFIIPLAYVFSTKLDFADYYLPAYMGWLGVPLFMFALWLFYRSHTDLGKNWSPVAEIKKDQTLVTGGVYSKIRHPMYSAHFLWATAQVLLLHNWVAGPSFLVTFFPFYFHRVGLEEEMMTREFGDEYREYIKRTGRLVPKL
jgi:protein-S-isoprenylcysteine O-methyltransferase Ste14